MAITLYKMDDNAAVRAVNMTLELIGLDVKRVEMNVLDKVDINQEYLRKNPLYTVPTLEDGDVILSESHTIIQYLVTKYGGKKQEELYPSDLKLRSRIHHFLYFDAWLLFPRICVVGIDIKSGLSIAPNERQRIDLEEAYGFLETYLQNSKYLVGDRLTLADISCVSTLSTIDYFIPLDKKYVKVHEWWNRIKKEAWYQKGNEPGLKELHVLIERIVKKNAENLGLKL